MCLCLTTYIISVEVTNALPPTMTLYSTAIGFPRNTTTYTDITSYNEIHVTNVTTFPLPVEYPDVKVNQNSVVVVKEHHVMKNVGAILFLFGKYFT